MEKKDLRIKEYMGEYSIQKETVTEAIEIDTNEKINIYGWVNIDNKVFSDLQTARMWVIKFIKAKAHYHEI